MILVFTVLVSVHENFLSLAGHFKLFTGHLIEFNYGSLHTLSIGEGLRQFTYKPKCDGQYYQRPVGSNEVTHNTCNTSDNQSTRHDLISLH